MRTVFEEEEEDLSPLHEQDDRELTLSSTTLLVIFFGLVLVCGLFFGLGYTLGHRSSTSAAERESTPASETPAPASAPATSFDSKPKPTAATPTAAIADPAPSPSTDDVQPASTSSDTPSQPAALTVKPALVETKPVAPVQAAKVSAQPAATPASAPSGIMVQIAAVSNPADADVLIGALQKHGYTVAARHQPSDTLIHVQIGPFPTRADAVAMRQKLLGDGYNAIIK